MIEKKTYLGDGAYAEFDGFSVWITTENGVSVTNRVCLEPQVIAALLRWLPGHYDRRQLAEALGVGDE